MIVDDKNTKYKKILGSWGESFVDVWMNQQGWSVEHKNLRIFQGEIDRVYKSIKSSENVYHCIAEIKTVHCKNRIRFLQIFTDAGLKNIIKKKQCLNLYKFSETFLRFKQRQMIAYQPNIRHQKNQLVKNKVYIRFFLVLKMYQNYMHEHFFCTQTSYRVCLQTKSYLILSFTPDFY